MTQQYIRAETSKAQNEPHSGKPRARAHKTQDPQVSASKAYQRVVSRDGLQGPLNCLGGSPTSTFTSAAVTAAVCPFRWPHKMVSRSRPSRGLHAGCRSTHTTVELTYEQPAERSQRLHKSKLRYC